MKDSKDLGHIPNGDRISAITFRETASPHTHFYTFQMETASPHVWNTEGEENGAGT